MITVSVWADGVKLRDRDFAERYDANTYAAKELQQILQNRIQLVTMRNTETSISITIAFDRLYPGG